MQLSPFSIERFSGLNLVTDPQELGLDGSPNQLNIDVNREGRARTRDGYVKHNTNTIAAGGYQSIWTSRQNGGELLGIRNSGALHMLVDKMSSAGVVANVGDISGSNTQAVTAVAHIGTATATTVYIASTPGSGANPKPGSTLRKYDGAALSNGVGKPLYVAPYPRGGRLIQGHYALAADSPSGANGSPSTVFISDEGAPDTYQPTNFVHLRPGDGEFITAIVTWREQTFVFKQTMLYVFFGEDPDDDGLPIFRVREVPLTTSIPYAPGPLGQFAVAGNDGVYFSGRDGIYVTTGFVPRPISDAVSPMWTTLPDVFVPDDLKIRRIGQIAPTLSWARNQLFAYYVSQGSHFDQTLMWDEATKAWRVWNFSGRAVTMVAALPYETTATGSLALGPVAFFVSGPATGADNEIYRLAPDLATDNGSAIPWSYDSGYYDLGSPGEKSIRFTDVYGSGTMVAQILALGVRSGAVADAGTSLVLGSEPTVGRDRHTSGARGRLFAHRLSGSGRAVITRVEHRVMRGNVQ
jgi:hypothetical protein